MTVVQLVDLVTKSAWMLAELVLNPSRNEGMSSEKGTKLKDALPTSGQRASKASLLDRGRWHER